MANSSRIEVLLAAARHNPQYALRLLASLPAAARGEALRRWATEEKLVLGGNSASSGPSLRKCGPPSVAVGAQAKPGLAKAKARGDNAMAAQLRAFSRAVRGPSSAAR